MTADNLMQESKDYKGREHSGIKHWLLETYLEMLFMIIGQHEPRICYVDCFAGPWQESDENLSGTSIALSLNVIRKCRDSLQGHKKNVEFRALFVEKNKRSYKKLCAFLKEHQSEGIETHAFNGEFHELRQEILDWCSRKDFVFFFIDPKGWKNAIELPTLTPLLQRPRSEFLINFMYDFLLRTHTQPEFQSDMQAIFGEVPDTSGMSPKERENFLIERYRSGLKDIQPSGTGKLRSAYVTILDRTIERTKYHLVYLTRHPLGIVKFMEASEKMNAVQKRVRAKTKQEQRIARTGQGEFLWPEPEVDSHDGEIDMEEVKQYWLRTLSTSPSRFGIEQLADMLEETNWFETDLQQAFNELLEDSAVRNLDARGKRPKNPIHFKKNEHLQRT